MSRFINSIKRNMEIVKSAYILGYKRATGLLFVDETLNNEEYNIPNDIQFAQWNLGVKGSGAVFGIATVDGLGRKAIYTDNEFKSLSENGKAFIINHELGHLMLGHLENINEKQSKKNNKKRVFNYIFKNVVSKTELEADAFAANKIGKEKAIKGLIELNQVVPNKEIKLRIKALKELSM